MKRLLCLALIALLCVPAWAEDYEEGVPPIAGAQSLELGEIYYLDLDGDGEEEVVRVSMQENDYEEILHLQVETDALVYGYDPYIIYMMGAYAADLDGDGKLEILLSGDEASADYLTWCLTFSREGGLQPIPFADADRSQTNTDGYFESGYGRLDAIDGATLTLIGSQDALGTWMCSREFTLRDGKFELDDGGIWRVNEKRDESVWDYRCLTTTRELPVTLEDGSASTLPAGTSFLVTETDKQSFVGFETKEGQRGRISVEPNIEEGWGFLINGASENDYFEYIPYAD